jgi:small conductance mechanosensitive channel
LSAKDAKGSLRKQILLLVAFIVLYVILTGAVNYFLTVVLSDVGIVFPPTYSPYVNILLALAFGYLIVNAFASAVYWSLRARVPHPTASAVRSMLRIVGLGALAAVIAGGVAGGAAGVALGGFLGLVVGTATQNVLGQAVSGLFLLMSRPFKAGERVNISSEEGIVDDVSTLFTTLVKDDGTRVLVPNNSVVGTKILIRPVSKPVAGAAVDS